MFKLVILLIAALNSNPSDKRPLGLYVSEKSYQTEKACLAATKAESQKVKKLLNDSLKDAPAKIVDVETRCISEDKIPPKFEGKDKSEDNSI